jgi:hypothetical protein
MQSIIPALTLNFNCTNFASTDSNFHKHDEGYMRGAYCDEKRVKNPENLQSELADTAD